jgi:SAM-dependent methyltransferase
MHPCCADLWRRSLPIRARSQDVVLAGEILEHLPFPENLVSEIARVLAPGGVALGSVPNSFRLKNRLRFLTGGEFEPDPTHLRHFSPTSLRQLLAPHLSNVHIVPCVGRFSAIAPRLLGNDLVWSGRSRG